MHYYCTDFPLMLQIGRGYYNSILREQFPSLHFFDLTAHKHVRRGENEQLIVLDIKSARATYDLVRSVYLLGHILDVMTADLLCHIPLEALGIRILALRCSLYDLSDYSHIICRS